MRGILENLPEGNDKATMLDMGATPEPFSRGTLKPIDVMLLVAEPYYKSLEAVVRMDRLARDLGIPQVKIVANKVKDKEHEEAIEEICRNNGLELLMMLPYNDFFLSADFKGVAPIDLDEDSPGISQLKDLAKKVEDLVKS
ncbi:MAG: hypothetical protein ACRDIU_05300 [Actinomycetota bacterium]